MYKKKDLIDEEFFNADKFDEDDFGDEIMNVQNQELLWYLEELDIITDCLKSHISEEQRDRLKKVAEILVPYFQEFMDHENPKIKKFCKLGYARIVRLFPEFYSEHKE